MSPGDAKVGPRFNGTRANMGFLMGGGDGAREARFPIARVLQKVGEPRNLHFCVPPSLFAGALQPVRSQAAADEVAWMKDMIPHHSIAILTSERAKITDPRVRNLADGIIEAQRREIAEMEALIKELD